MTIARLLDFTCALALLSPAVAKGWALVTSGDSTTPLLATIAIVETALGALFLMGRHLHFATAAMAMLASGFVSWHLVQGNIQPCGCIGLVEIQSAHGLLLASAYLGVAGVRGLLLERPTQTSTTDTTRDMASADSTADS